VWLRYHRGPVYTVPFGDLGAVQNLSHDWVIDKRRVGIPYDSNLEKARKLIKAIAHQRKALAMIKTACDANGVKFAFPTVQIAGGTEAAAVPASVAAAASTIRPAG